MAAQAQALPTSMPLPTMTLSSGSDPQPALAAAVAAPVLQAATVPQAQSALSSGPPSISLGGPSDMQLAAELGLLPTSPLSTGNIDGGNLLSCTAISAPPAQLAAAAGTAASGVQPMLQHAAPQVQPAAAAPGVAGVPQLVPNGAGGLQAVATVLPPPQVRHVRCLVARRSWEFMLLGCFFGRWQP